VPDKPEQTAKPDAKDAKDAEGKPAAPRKKRERRVVPRGTAHVKASFNNTIVSIADPAGNVIAWSSAGAAGWKGSRKSTPYAAQVAAENAARKALDAGMKTLEVFVRGPGAGREAAIRALEATGLAVPRSPMSRRSRTTGAALPSGGGSRWLVTPVPSAACAAARA